MDPGTLLGPLPVQPDFVSHLFTEDVSADASLVSLASSQGMARDKGAGHDGEGLYSACSDRAQKPPLVTANACLGLTGVG